MIQKVFKDNISAIYNANPTLFNNIVVNGITLNTEANFIAFVNSDLFATHPILNFINVY